MVNKHSTKFILFTLQYTTLQFKSNPILICNFYENKTLKIYYL